MRLIYTIVISCIAFAVHAQSYFTNIKENSISLRSDQEQTIIPDRYQLVELDIASLKDYLLVAPPESSAERSTQELTLQLPMPDGRLKTFYIYESPNMMPGISARYPSIKSYKGYGRASSAENVRLSVSHKGLHAAVRTLEGTVYIDPYATNEDKYYMSYFVRDHHPVLEDHQTSCGTHTDDVDALIEDLGHINPEGGELTQITLRGENVPLRQYRLAIACTGEFGQIRNGIPDILADINTTVNRLNMIFENELSIRMMLIDENDQIVYEDPATDPYPIPSQFPEGQGSGRWLLQRNTGVLNSTIGDGSYDLGHIYHRSCTDVGGIAYLGSICTDIKGGGVTCHSSQNLEYVTVSIAAHEMGHQLGSPHSFNNCGGNESIPDGYEPGSGTTIMSYAGLCQSNNVAGTSDDYYHVGSLMNIYLTTREINGSVCAEETDINNHAPDVSIPRESGFFIPIGTPFILTGEATDEDGDQMTYNWEQTNSGPISPLGNPSNNAPSFRSFYPDENRTRIFPRENKILANFTDKTEVLPSYTRDLEFHFVARDNNPEGGTVSWTDIAFRALDTAGPFEVTYPTSSNTQFDIGDEIVVMWDVANTDAAPISCTEVDIYMIYNGDLNTDEPSEDIILLAERVPNDGEYTIVIPNRMDNQIRILIRASDNIFFDVNNNNLNINEPDEETAFFDVSALRLDFCSDERQLGISTEALGGYAGPLTIEVEGLPQEASFDLSNDTPQAGESVLLTIDLSNIIDTEEYEMIIRAYIPDGGDTLNRMIPISNTAVDFSELAYVGPENGTTGGTALPTLEWTEVANATRYYVEIATNPSFEASTIVQSNVVEDNNFTPQILLDNATVYYWRVRAENDCREGEFPEIYAFSTETLTCVTYTADNLPINISQSGVLAVEAEIQVDATGQVADVNVAKLRGLHERNKDLSAFVVAPTGEEVKLFGNECGNQSNFNCSFDDESPNPFSCPLNSQQTYTPEEPLASLKGLDINGLWKLRLQDNVVGNGGKLDEVRLQICSNLSLDPPILVNLSVLQLPPGARQKIRSPELLTTDANNTDDEIVYTLIELPEHGDIELNGVVQSVGDQWTQDDINFSRVKYAHSDDGSTMDAFKFDVQDGEGGWVSITRFDIEIDESFTTSTADTEFDESISIYPNPAQDRIVIDHETNDELNVQILDVMGKIHSRQVLNSNQAFLAVDQLPSGIYLVEIKSGDLTSIKKLLIQR